MWDMILIPDTISSQWRTGRTPQPKAHTPGGYLQGHCNLLLQAEELPARQQKSNQHNEAQTDSRTERHHSTAAISSQLVQDTTGRMPDSRTDSTFFLWSLHPACKGGNRKGEPESRTETRNPVFTLCSLLVQVVATFQRV